MHRAAGNVSEAMVALNEKDMHDIREKIKQDNRLCGLKDGTKVNVEGDTCYNNPLFNSGEHTPFQGGTIALQPCAKTTPSPKGSLVFMSQTSYAWLPAAFVTKELQWIVQIMTENVRQTCLRRTLLGTKKSGTSRLPGKLTQTLT